MGVIPLSSPFRVPSQLLESFGQVTTDRLHEDAQMHFLTELMHVTACFASFLLLISHFLLSYSLVSFIPLTLSISFTI